MKQQLRTKLSWYAILTALTLFLLWRALYFDTISLLAPGIVLLGTSAITLLLAIRSENYREARYFWLNGVLTIVLGLSFLDQEMFSTQSLAFLVSLWLLISIVVMSLSSNRPLLAKAAFLAAALLGSAAMLRSFDSWGIPVAIGIALYEVASTAVRLSVAEWHTGHSALLSRLDETTDSELSRRFASNVAASEPLIRHIDGLWVALLIFVLFEIHLNRMGFTGNLGILPALIALVCDLLVALVIAFVIVLPVRLWASRYFRRFENRAIAIVSRRGRQPIFIRLVHVLFIRHLRLKIRLTKARFSIPALLWQGLISGLPIVVIITATVPLLGMSWFFDTEKWASIGRDRWAAMHTDRWRMEMVAAANPETNPPLTLDIPGVTRGTFSFIVVGDPGQGGLSQRALAKQIVETSKQGDVRFVLVSSDVVYPNGEMKDYEKNFWSPFSGVTVPIVAIPGNHDWYDGLDSFAATFFTPKAARAAISARAGGGEGDANALAFADRLIAQVNSYNETYGLNVQRQTSPYFQIVSDDFVLLCIDTGVIADADPVQLAWLRRALVDARGKTKMVVLGHPFFATNHDMTLSKDGLARILGLLRDENVAITMAGDTHDLEYYFEQTSSGRVMHHFVNGGGGAFVSIGSSFGAPAELVTNEWAYFPSRQAVIQKLDAALPPWTRPLWWWTQAFNGYPFSSDTLSTAFDLDQSPFLNSFLLVQVDRANKQIRVIPYGVRGRLKWSDFTVLPGSPHPAQQDAEWVIPTESSP